MPAEVPTTPGAASSRKGAEGVVVVTSLVVLTFWGYRKLVEPSASEAQNEPALAKIIGLEPKPASSAQFAVAFGFVFFTLSVGAMAAPELASAFAILVAVGYVLANGQSVFADISKQLGATPRTPATGVSGGVYAGPSIGGPASGLRGAVNAGQPVTVSPVKGLTGGVQAGWSPTAGLTGGVQAGKPTFVQEELEGKHAGF